jgi:predicted TIM-barrel fold metal-dependent hydrolase
MTSTTSTRNTTSTTTMTSTTDVTDGAPAAGTRVISADNHIIDPRDLYVERLPPAYRDRAPRVVRADDGGDGWSWEGRPPARTFGLEAVAGQPTGGDYRPSGLRWEEILPGNYDGAEHLKDMDRDGIDAAVLYPSVAMASYVIPDREFALAVVRTYNDWLLDDFCAVAPERLVGLCALPVDDGAELAVAELERCAAKGAKGFFLPGAPARPYWDRAHDPLWRAACDADRPVSFHRNHGGRPPAGEEFDQHTPGINVGGIVVRFFSAVQPLTYMIYTGVFERFPTLRVVAAEVNCGWLPFWRQTLDQNFEQQRHWASLPFDAAPSGTLGRNVFVTALDDWVGFAALRDDPTLADAVMYSIDYPHSVSLWPESRSYVERLTAGMDPVARDKVLAANAARIYRL